MRKIILPLIAASLAAVTAAPALADNNGRHYRDDDRHGRYYRDDDRRGRYDDRRYDDRRGRYASYDDRGRYNEPRRVGRNDRVWRGNDGRYYCERENGTTGLIIGAAGGALLGREIDGGRERTLGTVLGAAVGGLLGREVDRGDAKCR